MDIGLINDKKTIESNLNLINELTRDIALVDAQIEEAHQKNIKEFSNYISKREKTIKELAAQTKDLVLKNRKVLFEEAGKKTITFRLGEVSIQWNKPAVYIRGEEKVVQALKDHDLKTLIRKKEEINKEKILEEKENLKDELLKIKGLSIIQKEQLSISTPAMTKSLTFEIKKDKII